MIPIQLTLQGVYSYQEKQVIDFEPLTQAGLFGIFGKVGSGKSSIVEAITYVLYGETNRINGRESIAYNMTNLRSKTFFIEYIFRVNAVRYQFVAQGKRNSKNFHDMKISRNAAIWNEEINDWSPINADAVPILGLKYNDFRRAVIVPQGNFQEFLELKGLDRSVMMQDLFGLEKFDLAAKATVFRDANNLKINSVEERIAALGEVSEEALAALSQELIILQEENDLRQKSLTLKRENAAIFALLKQQIADAFAKKQTLQQFENQVLVFQDRKKQLSQYQTILAYVKPVLSQLENAEIAQKEANANLAKAEKNLTQLNEKNKLAQQSEASLKIQYEQRDVLKLEAEDWRNLLNIKRLEKEINSEKIQQAQGEKENIVFNDAISKLKETRQTAQQNFSNLSNATIDIVEISEILSWFSTAENLQSGRASLKKEADEIVAKQKDLLSQKKQLKFAQCIDIQDDTALEDIEKGLLNTFADLQEQGEKWQSQRLVLLQQKALQEHASALQEGEPCPLCGAAHHPQPLSDNADLSGAIQKIEAQIKQTKAEETQLNKQKDILIQLKTAAQFIENEKARITKDFNEKLAEIAAHQTKFTWKNFSADDKESVKKAQVQYNNSEAEKKKLQQLLSNIQQEIEQKEANGKEKTALLQNVALSLAAKEATKEVFEKTLKKLAISAIENNTEKDILAKADTLEKQFQTIETDYQKAKEYLQDIANQLIKSNVETENCKNILAKANENATLENEKLQVAITQSGFENVAQVKAFLSKNISVADEEAAIEKFYHSLRIAQHEADTAAAEINNKTYDEAAHQVLVTEIQSLDNQINIENERIGIQKNNIEKAKDSLAKQADLLTERTALKDRGTNIAALESLFKGKGFVNYVSRVYLENVVGIANERFHRMTQRQLKLQLADDNAFEVLDLLNDGHTRSVKTLSGGQKFQASLCLALALADSISSTHRENFFFLDEGFGSLDKNSLQIVFETLQSLRKENRVVGIISHVEEMQQEIERYIHVVLEESVGSVVEIV
jgi:DNA repair protein SbcC/Rad50